MKYQNPILRGFYPDPSICRVDEDYYLVTSTFEFFPGVPIFHSKNLVEWEQIGHCLTRKSQLPLDDCENSRGIYAPTIRYHQGIFYMVTTNKTHGGNFLVYTDDIRGEWSEPVMIDQNGIDPSLFWDDDGTCIYTGKGTIGSERGIVGFAIDPKSGTVLSEKKLLSPGCGGQCAEGPHIFKKDDDYYLLIAEGGTAYGHRETVQRSKHVWGPYEPCPHNPILTHAEYKPSGIQAVGHADVLEDQNGNWWAVCLGIRVFADVLLHNLGRETFLVPVQWESGWPIAGDGGKIDFLMEGPLPGTEEIQGLLMKGAADININFSREGVDKRLLYTRNPDLSLYKADVMSGRMFLSGMGIPLDKPCASPTMLSVRQPEFNSIVTAQIDLSMSSDGRYGIAAYYNNYYHYDIYVVKKMGHAYVGFYKHVHDFGCELYRCKVLSNANIYFKIVSDREKYSFFYRANENECDRLAGTGVNAGLCTEASMERCYTGTLFSMFCEEGIAAFCNGFQIRT